MKFSKLAVAVSAAFMGVVAMPSSAAVPAPSFTINGEAVIAPDFGANSNFGHDGDSITIESTDTALSLMQKTAQVNGELIKIKNGNIGAESLWSDLKLGNEKTKLIEISGGTYGLQSYGDYGNYPTVKAGAIDVTTDQLIINRDTKYGVWAQTGIDINPRTDMGKTPDRAAGAYVNINAKNTVINASDIGLVAFSNGRIDVHGNLTINSPHVIDVRGNSLVNINPENAQSTVVLNGDIAFETPGPLEGSGKKVNAFVNINLNGATSYWKGHSWAGHPDSITSPDSDVTGGVVLSLSNGAAWIPTVHEPEPAVMTLAEVPVVKSQAINTLKLDKGIVKITSDALDVKVGKVEGEGQVFLTTDGKTAGKLSVSHESPTSQLTVGFVDQQGQEYTADNFTAEQAQALKGNVSGAGVQTTATVKEGMYQGAITVGPKNESTQTGNTLMRSSLEMTAAAPLAMNRILMNDVRKRLGDLRVVQDQPSGVWARYDGGRLSGENGLENRFNTLQVGADTVVLDNAVRVGAALGYTQGDVDYARGSADMDAFSLSGYGVWFGDNGLFADVIARVGQVKNDMTVDGTLKGETKNMAYSLSAEGGWRMNLTDRMYVEPQTELTYTYINSDEFGIGTARYTVDATDSLIGRIGMAAGLACPSGFGDVYMRASLVHEFLGDAQISGGGVSETIDGKDTWYEYGIGANVNINKTTYVYADVERTGGAKLDEDWRANVGVRYSF